MDRKQSRGHCAQSDPVRDGVFRRAVPLAAAGAGGGRVREQWNLLLRGAPATTARILARMPNGAPVRILNSYDDWSVVDYDGLLGWAKSEYLRPLP